MPQIAIITDSIACLPGDLQEKYHIQIVPLTLLVAGQVYHDGVDITPSQVYELFLKDPDSFKAAPATPEEFLTVLRKAAQTAMSIFCITVSLKISTMFNVARLAIERAKIELPGVRIELLDSATATAAEGFIALAAARAVDAGKNLEEVIQAAVRIKEKVNAVVMLDTMRHVYRSGRVPKIAAQAGSMLNIRPIFTVPGSVHFMTAVRNKKSGIEKLKSMMREKVGGQPVHCAVMHAYAPDEALKLKEQVAAEFNCTELWITEFSPVMGYATGTGTLGLAFYADP
jgi:DegV family protein with EDD domain